MNNKTGLSRPGQHGFSLVEVAVAVVVLSVALVGTMSAFPYIMRGILMTKAKSIASTVATEQLAVYKNMPYYKLQVTTYSVTDTRFIDSVEYDIGYYPKEITTTGGIVYEKMTYVEKVAEDSTGVFSHVDWTQPDVGMKRVTVYVAYHSEGAGGDWKKTTMSILMENTDRQQLNATISGLVKTTDTAVTKPIPNAGIYILENPSFNTSSENDGSYEFNVPAGSWTLVTTATGYFMDTSTPVVCSSGTTTTKNIKLTKKFLGTVTGYAFLLDHIVITQVVPKYAGGGAFASQEYIELYNPTTYSILIASKSEPTSNYDLWYVTVTYFDTHNLEPPDDHGDSGAKYLLGNPNHADSVFKNFRTTSTAWDLRFPTMTHISIPPQSFFLIANVSTVTYGAGLFKRTADAYYRTAVDGDLNIITDNGAGGIRVTGTRGYVANSRSDWHDGLGWGSASASVPSKARESSNGLPADAADSQLFSRQMGNNTFAGHDHWYTCGGAFGTCFSGYRNSASPSAYSWDTDNNAYGYSAHSAYDGDWFSSGLTALNMNSASYYDFAGALFNADTTAPPSSGTPAKGAHVTANDGLSSTAFVQNIGSFTLTDVATGAWTVAIISASPRNVCYMEISAWMGSTTPKLGIPNNFTTPQWQNGTNFSTLTFVTTNGTIAGRVTNANGIGLSNITIDAVSQTAQTNSQGYYRINIASGSYAVGCNMINTNNSYTKSSSDSVIVELGQITDGVNFTLVSGGGLRGFVTANGVDPLPGYVVSLQRDGAEYKTATTGSDGRFLITNVATCSVNNPYLLYLVTDNSETVDISTGKAVVPTMGSTIDVGTFRVTAGYGTLSGRVTYGGLPIETGVVLVTSTQPIASISSGPVISGSLVNGPTIFYFAASDSAGNYSMRVLGGTQYYLYGYYADDTVGFSSSTIRKSSTSIPIAIGQSKTINFSWP